MPPRICENCGGNVPSKRRLDATYCSDKCGSRCRNRRFYALHIDEQTARRQKYLADHPKKILSRVKSRAKGLGIPFNLTVEDIIIPKTCPVLGIEINVSIGKKGYCPNSPSVDRIKPEIGYIKGNVRIISARANLLKSNASLDEMRLVLEDMGMLHAS